MVVSHRHDVRSNSYCGPAALSAVTGYTAELCAAIVEGNRLQDAKTPGGRQARRRIVRGMTAVDMLHAVHRFGLLAEAPTAFTKEQRQVADLDLGDDRWILGVRAPLHWIAIVNGFAYDTHNPQGVRAHHWAESQLVVTFRLSRADVAHRELITEDDMWPANVVRRKPVTRRPRESRRIVR